MSELWNKIPSGASGWIFFACGLFISPLAYAFVRDHISKPVATWLLKKAMLLVTLGFRSGRDRLFRDIGQRKIEPAVVTIYFLVAVGCGGILGRSVDEYQRLDPVGGPTYSQSIEHMTAEQLIKERDATERELAGLKRDRAILGLGLGAFYGLFFLFGAMRFKIISTYVRAFDHQLAKSLPHLSFQDERIVRAEFAKVGSYADYVRVMDALIALTVLVTEKPSGDEFVRLPTDPTNPASA